MSQFLDELKQRKVFRAAAIYAVAAWAVIQVCDTVLPRLGAPEWTVTFVIVLAALGFPIVLLVSWLFDINKDGVQRAPRSSSGRAVGLVGLGMMMGLVVFGAYWRVQPKKATTPDENSIVVLPFADMSATRDQAYLGDGITEEILNALAQIRGLRVPARATSFSFKGKNLSTADIARQLNVAHVLDGSVQKQGDQLRIIVQLTDARNDRLIWSNRYERKLDDAFAVQDEIAKSIVDALQLQLKQSQLVEKETASGRAHEAYLKGLYYWNRRHADELPSALEQFNAAIREDPSYARAWAGIALTYAVLPQYTKFDPREASREGKKAAAKALALDPKAADAHAALSQIAQELDWEWDLAVRHGREAVNLDPGSATAHQWLAEVLLLVGRYDEAFAEVNRALELDPLSTVVQNVKAFGMDQMGKHEDALALFREIMKRDPKLRTARSNAIESLLALGRFQEAAALAGDDAQRTTILLIADRKRKPEAVKRIAAAAREPGIRRSDVAAGYFLLEMPDSGFAQLLRAADEWESSLAFTVNHAWVRRYASHPQYAALVRRLKLPASVYLHRGMGTYKTSTRGS